MTAGPCKYLAPRRYVPQELKGALVGNLDESASLAIAYMIRRRIDEKARPRRVVFVDVDLCVYAARPDTASADLFIAMHPHLFVGTYDRSSDVHQIAADLEQQRREMLT